MNNHKSLILSGVLSLTIGSVGYASMEKGDEGARKVASSPQMQGEAPKAEVSGTLRITEHHGKPAHNVWGENPDFTLVTKTHKADDSGKLLTFGQLLVNQARAVLTPQEFADYKQAVNVFKRPEFASKLDLNNADYGRLIEMNDRVRASAKNTNLEFIVNKATQFLGIQAYVAKQNSYRQDKN